MQITQIAANSEGLYALSDDGKIYRYGAYWDTTLEMLVDQGWHEVEQIDLDIAPKLVSKTTTKLKEHKKKKA